MLSADSSRLGLLGVAESDREFIMIVEGCTVYEVVIEERQSHS